MGKTPKGLLQREMEIRLYSKYNPEKWEFIDKRQDRGSMDRTSLGGSIKGKDGFSGNSTCRNCYWGLHNFQDYGREIPVTFFCPKKLSKMGETSEEPEQVPSMITHGDGGYCQPQSGSMPPRVSVTLLNEGD